MSSEFEIFQSAAGYIGSGGGGMLSTFLFYKWQDAKRSKDYDKNGKDRRNGKGLNDALSRLSGAVEVKTEVTQIMSSLQSLNETSKETKTHIDKIWDQTNANANSISEIKGYIEGKK